MKKTRSKLYVSLVTLLILLSIILGACAQEATPTEPPVAEEETTAPETSDKPFAGTTINILLETVPDTDYVQELLPQFEEETGIDVNVEVLTYVAMYEKLVPQLSVAEGSGAYDVIVVDKQWVGGFVGADWLIPLDDYIAESGFDPSVYIPSMFV